MLTSQFCTTWYPVLKKGPVFNMGNITAISLACLLLALFSSLVASVQVNIALLNVHLDYIRRRINLARLI